MKKSTIILLVYLAIFAIDMYATANAQNLPWEGPLDKIVKSISGPVAFGISVIALVGAGAMLIFGGEIAGFLKTVLFLILVISIIIFATNLMTGSLFSASATMLLTP